MVRGCFIDVTRVPSDRQWAEMQRIAVGRGMRRATSDHARLNSLSSIAFIGLPCPMNSTGISVDFRSTARAFGATWGAMITMTTPISNRCRNSRRVTKGNIAPKTNHAIGPAGSCRRYCVTMVAGWMRSPNQRRRRSHARRAARRRTAATAPWPRGSESSLLFRVQGQRPLPLLLVDRAPRDDRKQMRIEPRAPPELRKRASRQASLDFIAASVRYPRKAVSTIR